MANLQFTKDVNLKLKYRKDISCYNHNYYEILNEQNYDYSIDFGDKTVFIYEEANDYDYMVRLHLCLDTGEKYPVSIFSWCVISDLGVKNEPTDMED
jgi:hypothetical protein